MSEVEGELRWYLRSLPRNLKQLRILPVSDWHYGNPQCSVKHICRTLEMVESSPDMYMILNGDLCESATRNSKGNIYRQVGSPQDQRDWVIKKLLPFKSRILGVTQGNHEARIFNETGMDICKDIADALEAPYRAEGMLLKVSFGSGNNRHKNEPYPYWVYFTHGYGGARTKSAKAVKVERLSSWIDADVYVMSHDHVVNVAPDVYLKPINSRRSLRDGFVTGSVHAYRKMLIKSGAALKWGGYSEQLGFPPVDLEMPIIILAGTGSPRVSVTV